MAGLPLVGIVFSKNRALQLDLALRSLLLHCADAPDFPLYVIYRAAGEHAAQYRTLRAEYAQRANIIFVPERRFWADVLALLAEHAGPAHLPRYRAALRLGPRFSALRRGWMEGLSRQYVLFLVDDNIFVRGFGLRAALAALDAAPDALGFSLRLGANVTYCYPAGRPQALPEFAPAGPGLLAFDWTRTELDFGYPLEVSSSVYRIADLLPWLDGLPFRNPNELESRLAAQAVHFRSRPRLLCFHQSVTFCNPANRVNLEYHNRAGEAFPASAEMLAEKFAAGCRADAAAYTGFTPRACHQEVEIACKPPAGQEQC